MSKNLYVTYGVTLSKTYRGGMVHERERDAIYDVMQRNCLEVQKYEEVAGNVYYWQYKEIEVD